MQIGRPRVGMYEHELNVWQRHSASRDQTAEKQLPDRGRRMGLRSLLIVFSFAQEVTVQPHDEELWSISITPLQHQLLELQDFVHPWQEHENIADCLLQRYADELSAH